MDNYQSSNPRVNRVGFTDEKPLNGVKTTDDLHGGVSADQFSRSIGDNSRSSGQKQLANHGLTNADINSKLRYGAFQAQFIMNNKKAISKMIKQAMLKEDNEPFKGYLEVSNASQHLKKHNLQQSGIRDAQNSSMIEPSLNDSIIEVNQRIGSAQPGKRSSSSNRFEGIKAQTVNSKVMETWINETLADAEHLDIPGVILKPEHKNPISRYAIDRLSLTNAGIPNEIVDRVYRSLFVYSVGFYELIKKLVSHCQRKYSIITSIWKVFSVLLEYCCQSDYRMLISEITNQHEEEVQRMEKDFNAKCQEFLNNEKILKQNMEVMQKYSEELEKERTNERTLRLKLEEEYMQNSKNHEEEVQLRLKFESKLNSMHSIHRELEIKHKRLGIDLSVAQSLIMKQEKLMEEQATEIIILKTIKAENESKIQLLEEKKNTQEREIGLKNKLVQDMEDRMKKIQDENDLVKYQIHDQSKQLTEQRLRIDCLDTRIEGLQSDKLHLEITLKESRDFKKVYEDKNEELKQKLLDLMEEYNGLRQRLVGHEESLKNCNEKIELQKDQISKLKYDCAQFEKQNGTMRIELEKLNEMYKSTKHDLEDAVERLHLTNRMRHELEVRLTSEQESTIALNDTIKEKIGVIIDREQKIDKLETRSREAEVKCSTLEVQIESMEMMYELKITQLNNKVDSLNQVVESEKELKETWVEKFEKEQKDLSSVNVQMLSLKSKIKDLELELGNLNIKHKGQLQINEQLSENHAKALQDLNEKIVLIDNQKREITQLRSTHDQINTQKKGYIKKMLAEMDAMKVQMQGETNQEAMEKEEYITRLGNQQRENHLLKVDIRSLNEQIQNKDQMIEIKEKEIDQTQMTYEDYRARLISQIIRFDDLNYTYQEYRDETRESFEIRERIKQQLSEQILQLQKEKEEEQSFFNGQKVQFDVKTKSLQTKVSELIHNFAQLQNENVALIEKQKQNEEEERQRLAVINKPQSEQPKSAKIQTPHTERTSQKQVEQQQIIVKEVKETKETKDQETQTMMKEIKVRDGKRVMQENTFKSIESDSKEDITKNQRDVRQNLVSRGQVQNEVIPEEQDIPSQPGNKLIKEAMKRRDSMNRKLKEQQQILQLQTQLTVSRNGFNEGAPKSKHSQNQVNDDQVSSQNNNSEQPQRSESRRQLDRMSQKIQINSYSRAAANNNISPVRRSQQNSKQGLDQNKTGYLTQGYEDEESKYRFDDLSEIQSQNPSNVLRPQQIVGRNVIQNMESHQNLAHNKILDEVLPEQKTQMASEKKLLNSNSEVQSLNRHSQEESKMFTRPAKDDQVSLDTAQKYHYNTKVDHTNPNSQQLKQHINLSQIQQRDANLIIQNDNINSHQTLQVFSTIGSNKILPQAFTDSNVRIELTHHNNTTELSKKTTIQNLKTSQINNRDQVQITSNQSQIQTQGQQPVKQQQQFQQQQIQQNSAIQARSNSQQPYKKPDGGPSIKGMIRAAATRQQYQ
ncbi:UNKNOWN [Stylonychia lemnae]|uniref:Uncharacterized protein n=1 Tax=Stylonychia lemnae TaxID=5949 RepID=A0A077ZUH6_STYLE|nr:UNKNOWN [Stylonychia lemnae]|eukprot:CDW73527.1 UNKNOWN [Stylonychia lemnae]